jgi:Protein of unknown function (DUF1153)
MPYAPNETIASRIKRAGLPESHDIHWSESRKQEVVKAVRDKLITFDEARWRYLLSRKGVRTELTRIPGRSCSVPGWSPVSIAAPSPLFGKAIGSGRLRCLLRNPQEARARSPSSPPRQYCRTLSTTEG